MKNRRIFIMMIAAMLCLSVFATSYDRFSGAKYRVNTSINTSEKFKANSSAATAAHTKLKDAFRESDMKRRGENDGFRYTVSMITAEGYPEYYAGEYINTEGNLVVLLTEEYSGGLLWDDAKAREAKAEVRKLSGLNDIIFGTAKYSLRELIGTMEYVYNFRTTLKEKTEYQIIGTGLDTYENSVNVYIYPLNDDSINWFRKNVIDKPYLKFFEEKPNSVEATASITPGSRIVANDGGNSGFSVGFRAYKAGAEGFVTCAHSLINKENGVEILNNNNIVIGYSYEDDRQFSGQLDAAFVSKKSGHTVTNVVYDSNGNAYTMVSGYATPVRGETVSMCGQTTSGSDGTLLEGIILETSVEASYQGVYLLDLYKVSYYAQLGDSGGIVFSYDNGYKPAGIQVARTSDDSQQTEWYSYVCKAENIVYVLGLSVR